MKILLANKYFVEKGYSWNVFHKGDSFVKEGDPFFIPEFTDRVSASLMFAVKMKRLGKYIDKRFASRYYDRFTFGLNFVCEDLRSRLSLLGENWSMSQNFEKSCVFGKWLDTNELDIVELSNNGKVVSTTKDIEQDFFDTIDEVIEFASQYYTIKIGDVLCLDLCRLDIGKLFINDILRIDLPDENLLTIKIK